MTRLEYLMQELGSEFSSLSVKDKRELMEAAVVECQARGIELTKKT